MFEVLGADAGAGEGLRSNPLVSPSLLFSTFYLHPRPRPVYKTVKLDPGAIVSINHTIHTKQKTQSGRERFLCLL